MTGAVGFSQCSFLASCMAFGPRLMADSEVIFWPGSVFMLNWVVVVNCGIGGRIGATEKLYGELTETGPCRPGKSEGIGGPGLGSLKLVKTACGVPGEEELAPNCGIEIQN